MKYNKDGNVVGMSRRERELWVMNHKVLRDSWRNSRLSMGRFTREYKENIDEFIKKELNK